MRKIIFNSILLFLLALPAYVFPQFLRGVGVYGAETTSRDGYRNFYSKDFSQDPTFLHARPPSHRGGEYESWGAGIFLEMLNSDLWRWRTEIEYANKGSKEDELIDPILNTQKASTNTYKNIQWNNYLKRYVDLGLRYPTYALLGVRAEYSISKSTPAYSYVANSFHKINIGADLGLGMEIPLKRGWSIFVEEHYNPDAWFKYKTDKIWVLGRTWETRIGVIYRWKRGIGAYDIDCNAPRYHGR
jgi:hypothetical protein